MILRSTALVSSLILASISAFMLSGCSVVNINGSLRTTDDEICVVPPEWDNDDVHASLVQKLTQKGFHVTEKPAGTPPGACRQTIVYQWMRQRYWVPAVVKQYGIDMRLYVDGAYRANASFNPNRNLVSPHVRFVRFERYLGRTLDRFFPGRPLVGK